MVVELCMPRISKILMLERNKNTFIVVNKDNVSSNSASAQENLGFKKKKNAFADLKSLAEILFKKSKECEDGSWVLRPRETIVLNK